MCFYLKNVLVFQFNRKTTGQSTRLCFASGHKSEKTLGVTNLTSLFSVDSFLVMEGNLCRICLKENAIPVKTVEEAGFSETVLREYIPEIVRVTISAQRKADCGVVL